MILNNTLTPTGGGGSDNIRTPIIYSYVGTGECGPNHPNIITLDFEPVFIQLIHAQDYDTTDNWTSNYITSMIQSDDGRCYIDTKKLTTSYQENMGIFLGGAWRTKSYAKKSIDGKIIYWYHDQNTTPAYQVNKLNVIYYLLIF